VLIACPDESYRIWCVCDHEASVMRRPWPARGCQARWGGGGSPNKSTVFGLEFNYYFRVYSVLYKDVRLQNLTRYILIIKANEMHCFSNLFLIKNSTCFGQIYCPSSGVSTLYTQQ